MTTPSRRAFGLTGVLILLAVAVLTAAAWWMTGGRWLTIESPSMAQAAPVGTLVLTRPADVADLTVGDVISFRPPGMAKIYTHRIVELRGEGPARMVLTQGDANLSADGWVLHQADIKGVVVHRWWGMGWLLKALPLLVISIAVILLATSRFLTEHWRKPARLFLVPLAFAVAGLVYRPWVGLEMIDQAGTGSTVETPVARLVSTGVLPVRAFLLQEHETSVTMIAGQVGDLPLRAPDDKGRILVDGAVALHGWWWVAIVVACLLPLLYELLTSRADRRADDGEEEDESEDEPALAAV